ncbi:sensor histidine kinase [Deinococcus sp. KSM4-11]|uniref:sensor histidine kinase n=1 Tax=Deinococcus sp. KSM4-11 TaxID=2568654 RepID=UPI0010A32090|nr:sensor histidine kinase [Deinococcus sp. KSM4-11]THF85833.1 sensor histidine kinase [Deinococcus sp. KSM4-11]
MMVPMESVAQADPARPESLLAELRTPRTWRTALYLLLALPAGALSFGLLVGGVVGGVLTVPLLIGAGVLLGSLWLVGVLGDLHRLLAGLLGVRFARPLPPPSGGLFAWLRATLADPVTYRTLLFQLIQLPLAALCWVVLGALVTVIVLGVGSPLWLIDPAAWPVVWGDRTVTPSLSAVVGLELLGVGGLLVTAGVIDLFGRMWTRLSVALLSRDPGAEAARREVVALRRAAGRVALGDDLHATLLDLTVQARTASTADAVILLGADGTLVAGSGRWPDALLGLPDRLPGPGAADVRRAPDGTLLATLPVTLPVMAGGPEGGVLRARYAPGVRPGSEELAFLLSIADHVGTALHAAQLIERAGARAGELERARLARELHDSVAQALYGITLGAKTARATLESDPARTRQSLEYTIRLAEGGVSEMKALLFSLRPDALEEGGLVAALQQHAHALETRHGLTVHSDLRAEPPLAPDAQAVAYRVAQEAMHNVVKHARATQVWLELRVVPGSEVVLTVRDDGRGFDPQALLPGTLGQRSMRERAAGAGGTLSVHSGAGEGTTVTLHLPTDHRAAPGRGA